MVYHSVYEFTLSCLYVSNHLAVRHYRVTQAQSGIEALQLIQSGQHFNLMILDIMMPRMSGYEVCQTLRERFSANELPIVLLSAKNQIEDLVAGLQTGANDYLTKPISKEELLARIETHLNLKQLMLENLRRSEPAESIKQSVIADVFRYIGDQQVYDDITLLVAKLK